MSFIDTNLEPDGYPPMGTRLAVGGNVKTSELPTGEPFNEKDVEDLAVAMQRLGPFFLSHDVRSRESSRSVARDLLVAIWAMGYTKPEVTPSTLKPTENVETPGTTTAYYQAGNSR